MATYLAGRPVHAKRRESDLPAFSFYYLSHKDLRRLGHTGQSLHSARERRGAGRNPEGCDRTPESRGKTLGLSRSQGSRS